MTDPRYWLWLSLSFVPGSAQCDLLLRSFNGNPKAIYDAPPEAISAICKDSAALKSLGANRDMRYPEAVLDFCERNNIGILTQSSQHYPKALLRITGAPPVIYYKGRLPDFSSKPIISVVGTRDVTDYGKMASYTISHDLAYSGAIVVSGMAKGTDTYAHRGALDAGGHTIAILGCGIDVVYPKVNEHLMNEIILSGTVMTDFAPGQRPEGWHFPIRNRLISGISNGVLVIEAAAKSGALITASHALNQGKLLYAVPGKVGELASVGTNDLISKGAKMVTRASDIIADFSGMFSGLKSPPNYLSHTQNDIKHYEANPASAYRGQPNLQAAQPRPKVIYEDSTENYASKSHMPYHNTDNTSEYGYPYGNATDGLIYPDKVPPENGYTVELTEDKIKYFDRISNASYNRGFELGEKFTAGPAFDEIKKSRKPRASVSENTEPDLAGLGEKEAAILNYIRENGKTLADTLVTQDNSFSDIMLSLTTLELRKLIVQLPGGYFDIPKSDK